MERVMAPISVGLVLLGLLFVVGGLGASVAGHLEGLLVVFIGVAMLWAGWVGSQAKGLSCLIAAILNTMDAAITIASWNYEINPLVLNTGPTVFIAAKLLSSLAIVLYARTVPDPAMGGYALSIAFALIMAWNFSQLALLNIHRDSLTIALLWGSGATLAVALATFMGVAFRRRRRGTP
jgi:hypothetical protein